MGPKPDIKKFVREAPGPGNLSEALKTFQGDLVLQVQLFLYFEELEEMVSGSTTKGSSMRSNEGPMPRPKPAIGPAFQESLGDICAFLLELYRRPLTSLSSKGDADDGGAAALQYLVHLMMLNHKLIVAKEKGLRDMVETLLLALHNLESVDKVGMNPETGGRLDRFPGRTTTVFARVPHISQRSSVFHDSTWYAAPAANPSCQAEDAVILKSRMPRPGSRSMTMANRDQILTSLMRSLNRIIYDLDKIVLFHTLVKLLQLLSLGYQEVAYSLAFQTSGYPPDDQDSLEPLLVEQPLNRVKGAQPASAATTSSSRFQASAGFLTEAAHSTFVLCQTGDIVAAAVRLLETIQLRAQLDGMANVQLTLNSIFRLAGGGPSSSYLFEGSEDQKDSADVITTSSFKARKMKADIPLVEMVQGSVLHQQQQLQLKQLRQLRLLDHREFPAGASSLQPPGQPSGTAASAAATSHHHPKEDTRIFRFRLPHKLPKGQHEDKRLSKGEGQFPETTSSSSSSSSSSTSESPTPDKSPLTTSPLLPLAALEGAQQPEAGTGHHQSETNGDSSLASTILSFPPLAAASSATASLKRSLLSKLKLNKWRPQEPLWINAEGFELDDETDRSSSSSSSSPSSAAVAADGGGGGQPLDAQY